MIRCGSVFSGSGMLDVAVHSILGADPAWFCEYEPPTLKSPKPSQGAAKVLAHHWPDVPNLGDITEVDWTAVEPVEILTGGFPCQSVSAAGKRAGLRPGTRSGLWSYMRYAISQLRPELVVIENVRGLLSADADCDLECCTWCLGNDAGRPMRALGCVLGDLASLGYDAEWYGLRAADVGAPHGRFRIFITARPVTHPECGKLQRRGISGFLAGRERTGTSEGSQRQRDRDTVGNSGAAAADSERIRWGAGWGARPRETPSRRTCGDVTGRGFAATADADGSGQPAGSGVGRRTTVNLLPTLRASDGEKGGPNQKGSSGDMMLPSAVMSLLPTPTASDWKGPGPLDRKEPGHDDLSTRIERLLPTVRAQNGEERNQLIWKTTAERTAESGERASSIDWGLYGPAIHRWERILGRPAPPPTRTGARGGQQLSAEFCEWLMGWPKGWVTEVPGLSRNDMIRIAGNGVVPQQAAAALRHLLSIPNGAVA